MIYDDTDPSYAMASLTGNCELEGHTNIMNGVQQWQVMNLWKDAKLGVKFNV